MTVSTVSRNKVALVFALVVSFVLPYAFAPFGLDFTDTPYHINNFKHFERFRFVSLSYAFFNWFDSLFGLSLLHFRLLTYLFYQLMLCVVVLVLARFLSLSSSRSFTRSPTLLALLFGNLWLSCSFLSLPGYDAISSLLNGLAFLFIALYHLKGRSLWLVFCGISSGMAVLARLPNILIVPIVLTWIVARTLQRKKKAVIVFGDIAVYGLVFLAVSFLLHDYLFSAGAGVLGAAEGRGFGGNPNYALLILVKKYVLHAMWTFRWLGAVQLCVTLFSELGRKKSSDGWKIALAFALVFCLGSIFYTTMGNVPGELLSFMNALLFYMIGKWIYDEVSESRRDTSQVILAVGILAFAMVPAAGSNTGLIKVFTTLYLPVLLLLRWRKLALSMRWTLYTVLVLLAVSSVSLRLRKQYEDLPITHTIASVNHPKLYGLQTTPARKKFIEELCTDVAVSKANVMFVGRMRHLFDYLFNIDPGNESMFWGELDSPIYISQVADHIAKNHVRRIYLIPEYPESLNPHAEQTPMEKMFLEQGFALTHADVGCKVYSFEKVGEP